MLPYECVNGALHYKEIDLCFGCSMKLEQAIEQAKMDFVNRRKANDESTMESNI